MMNMKNFLGSRLKPSSSRKGNFEKERSRSLTSKLSVNEEYKEAFRTNSYIEIRTKAEDQLGLTLCSKLASPSSSSPSPSNLSFHSHFTDYLLDPPQETLNTLMQDSSFHTLLVKFFDFSSEACDMCETLLQCIQQIKINHNKIKRVIKIGKRVCNDAEYSPEKLYTLIFQELSKFASLNPLWYIINEAQFRRVHDANSDLLARLTSKRRSIRRKVRFFKFFKKLGGYSLMISHIAIVVTLLIIALHSILGVLAAPTLLGLCSLNFLRKRKAKRNVKSKSKRVTTLENLGTQIDIAAKGMFILINDLDTLSTLTGRLCDEIEHRKTIAEMCVKNRKIQMLKEALRELNGHEEGFLEQLNELEEHLYLCFHTINRSRRQVLAQITGTRS